MPCVRKKHCYNGVGDNHDDDNQGAATTAAADDDDADEGDDDDTDRLHATTHMAAPRRKRCWPSSWMELMTREYGRARRSASQESSTSISSGRKSSA